MKTFTVYARRIESFKVLVVADTAEEAIEIAEELDGDAFDELDGTMEFEIDNAQENKL
jgi:hypothetical protein